MVNGLDIVSNDLDQNKRELDNVYKLVNSMRRKVDNQADLLVKKSDLAKLL